MADLAELLERVKAATGPDRDLDCALAVAVDGFFIRGEDPWGRSIYCRMDGNTLVMPGQGARMLVREYTASLDAALALVERVRPGCRMDLSIWSIRPTHVGLRRPGDRFEGVSARAATPALALLAALLSALIAQPASGAVGSAYPNSERDA